MELGDQVSVKIKSAIRARLKEIGIVWDRELPDYVMVLIANKKSKEQMEKDLTIFLGPHTPSFTAWLHNVLKKLEECTIYRGLTKKKEEDKKSKSKRRASDDNHQETKKLKGVDLKSGDNIGDAASDSGSEEVISDHLSPVRIDEGVDTDVSHFSAPTLALSDMKLSSSVNHLNNIERRDAILEKKATESCEPVGRLEKEGTIRLVEKPKPKEKIEINWSGENTVDMDRFSTATKHFSPDKRNCSKVKFERNRSRSKSRSRISYQHGFDQGDHVLFLKRSLMKENVHKDEERNSYYRDSRGIFRRRDSEERRNGYDTNSRVIGKIRSEKDRNLRKRSHSRDVEVDKLPSLVKVTPRPVRHPAMQPPSNLILKAVAEAQKSIATLSLPQPDEKVQKKEKNRMSRKPVYRKKNVPVFQRENISVTLLNDRVIADKIREEDGDSLLFENNIRKQESQLNDGPEVERFTISLLSDDNDSLVASDFEDVNDEKILTEENYSEVEQNVDPINEPMDISSTTVVEESLEEADLREYPGQRFDRRRLGPRVVPDADTVLSFERMRMKQSEELKQSLLNQVSTCQYCSHFILSRRGLAPVDDSITKTIVNENVFAPCEGKIEGDENGKVIKCKFWPSCEAGSDCRFYHPKEYCRTLPNCKFGQKCLYYHPPCKFADKCLNVTCPYTHSTVAPPTIKAKVWAKVPLAPSNGQMCMYYPNCKKPFCPYQHSYSATSAIPCKFGINCTKGTCEFDHTQLAKNPYKWVNQGTE
ncbi:zinc finger CCCH domain-containing protein 14 isoform X2 [Halyomorpha halys]|uniref:zinc finger CCCH domain-containing protein 14 isoform X2 n=1 Tax=Halyomorpha halys TaxID=286706 RepID=UPI0006D4FADE|nr:zinc finger CCCH domain-containing protein 14 isoform X2 [Halyomorpha halys]